MPIGGFLDSFPSMLFVGAHAMFLLAGVWAWKKAAGAGKKFAPAFWLYVVSQLIFLAFFGGAFTMKMAVLLEQTLIVITMLWIAMQVSDSARA